MIIDKYDLNHKRIRIQMQISLYNAIATIGLTYSRHNLYEDFDDVNGLKPLMLLVKRSFTIN